MATITLEGCSGKSYEFIIHAKGTNFNSVGGVYYITKIKNNKHTRIYLGITNDLSTRFDNHHKEDCFEENGATHIAIHKSSSESEREKIEKDILCKYNFPCNEQNN
ncbi:hypothetical protein RQM59_06565 [Flavobacteriaceae bacterium S356]|uniref:GIY-YIG domain-containing protein n=1 Tax=Asprobacillus argus TaxID=3076534 RepID=A0ABU3LEF3_9FLAO|nr:hypothetical protein [Flavobacteriaceae bacterium S356]